MTTAYRDTFAADHLPPPDQLPDLRFDLPELRFPAQLNCASALLDAHIEAGRGDRLCVRDSTGARWTYADLQQKANRIAGVLVNDMGLIPGQRVLLRSPNNAMLAAAWLAVMKAGGIAVTTMPMLRAREIRPILEKARVSHALCHRALADELQQAAANSDTLHHSRFFGGEGPNALEAAMDAQTPTFHDVDTAADDTCILAFTSGTTGIPKATMHFHRDMLAICRCWCAHVLRPSASDVFVGSPPLGFTFGLGALLLFPLSVGASTVLLERASPPDLVEGIKRFDATIVFTGPTGYRAMAPRGGELRDTTLRRCVSAGEVLTASTRALWKDATGLELIDGIGTTELLHIFISADEASARPGATGKPVPGYTARVVGDNGVPVPAGQVGRLAVKGPTGCRYLADDRQLSYVQDGWNITGDAYIVDTEGYFHYQGRTDDLIVSAGYNISAIDVEDVLLQHPAVAECGVVGVPDEARSQLVKAFVVLSPGHEPGTATVRALQDFFKQHAAPYKYPREIAFVDTLPRTETGKLQRYKLRT